MAPNVTVSFWAPGDINGTPLLTIDDEDPYFKGLKLTPDLYSVGGWELTLARNINFALFSSGIANAEVFVRFLVHAHSTTDWFWGGVLSKRSQTVVHRDEAGAEEFVFGGAGPKQYLERYRLGIEQLAGSGLWNVDLSNGVWRYTEEVTAGRVLNRLVDEDAAAADPALPDMTVTFDQTDDSNGNPWTDTIGDAEGSFELPIGNSLLQTIWDLEDLADLFTVIDLGTVASPKYELNAYETYGEVVTGTAEGTGVCRIAEGVNISDDALTVSGVALRKATHVIVEGKEGVWTTVAKPSWSPGDYVKWEKISYSRSSSVAVLERAGLRWLRRQENADQELTVEIEPGADEANGFYFPGPGAVLWTGNTITIDTTADGSTHSPLDYNNADALVTGLELTLGPAGDDSTADKAAKSWDLKVILNRERGGNSGSPNQSSASTGNGSGCCAPHPPPFCSVPSGGTTLSSSDTDPADWPGSDLTTGSCWGGAHHMSMGGSGGQSLGVTVAPGDVVTGHINFHEQTGSRSWENNSNYAYVAWLKLEGPGVPILNIPIVNQLYYNTGCIDVTHEGTEVIPTGYNSARILFRYRLGGIRYRAWITSAAAEPGNNPHCIDPTLPVDSPFVLPSDTVAEMINRAITAANVGSVKRQMLNNSGSDLAAGDIVVIDSSDLNAVVTSTTNHQSLNPAGLILEGGSDQENVLVGWFGLFALDVNSPDTPDPDDYVFTSTVAGEADLNATRGEGAVGQIMDDGSGATAVFWWGTPDSAGGGGGGAPTTADYLVGTAQGGLSAEIVVGTTPGGELGGTWASPTVDATHSGSAHHTESHASRHADAGADPVDVTGLDGFPGGTSTYLRADGTFASPGGGGSGGSVGEGRPAPAGGVTAYLLPGLTITTMPTPAALGTGNRFYLPIIVQEAITLVNLMAECTGGTGAGRALRGGLYEADATWVPGALVLEGAFDCSSTGVKTIAAGPTTLNPGRYLVCYESNHASPAMRLWTTQAIFATTGGGSLIAHLYKAGTTYGALPDPGVAYDTIQVSAGGAQSRVLLQVNP